MITPGPFLRPTKIKLALTFLLMAFLPIFHLRYVTSGIVNCDGGTCPDMFSIVDQYSPVNLFVEAVFGTTKFEKLVMLPSTLPSAIIAFLAGYIAISFFLRHRQHFHGDGCRD